jgi:bis(5'-nucleosyl)-tetraphosphatase (symmetrical)
MTLYAVGDIQGCHTAFVELLRRMRFKSDRDRLWLVGDLVNRGPRSLDVLRHVIDLGDAVECVLGNHDLHMLAVAVGARRLSRTDTFSDVLKARDRDKLLDWLRRKPLLVHDAERGRALVHAGIPPIWSIKKALKQAARVETMLRSDEWPTAVAHMYGNLPRIWSKSLDAEQRMRYTINGFTRMRFCDKDGHMIAGYSGPPGTQPKRFMPWFDVAGRKTKDVHIVFGHWSALGVVERKNITALDSGCVWGRKLTAVALKRNGRAKVRVKC